MKEKSWLLAKISMGFVIGSLATLGIGIYGLEKWNPYKGETNPNPKNETEEMQLKLQEFRKDWVTNRNIYMNQVKNGVKEFSKNSTNSSELPEPALKIIDMLDGKTQ